MMPVVTPSLYDASDLRMVSRPTFEAFVRCHSYCISTNAILFPFFNIDLSML